MTGLDRADAMSLGSGGAGHRGELGAGVLIAGDTRGTTLDGYADASVRLSRSVSAYGRADVLHSSSGFAWDAMGGLRMRF